MGRRAYVVVVERQFVLKGCRNKKEVVARVQGDDMLLPGESISNIYERRKEEESLPLPDIKSIRNMRKKSEVVDKEVVENV